MNKQAVRERVWRALELAGVARFPFPPQGRIPNVAGAKQAAERLADHPTWTNAETMKANPDAPQLPARRRALRDGKRLYVAVPRLREEHPFLELDPARLTDEEIDDATTVSGISEYGVPVSPESMPTIDFILSGSVAVADDGTRIGKGEGYADLEYGLLAAFDCVDETTTVATTVHPMQRIPTGLVTADAHDVPLDSIVTPEKHIETDASERPDGIDWDRLDEEKRAAIPALARLAKQR